MGRITKKTFLWILFLNTLLLFTLMTSDHEYSPIFHSESHVQYTKWMICHPSSILLINKIYVHILFSSNSIIITILSPLSSSIHSNSTISNSRNYSFKMTLLFFFPSPSSFPRFSNNHVFPPFFSLFSFSFIFLFFFFSLPCLFYR